MQILLQPCQVQKYQENCSSVWYYKGFAQSALSTLHSSSPCEERFRHSLQQPGIWKEDGKNFTQYFPVKQFSKSTNTVYPLYHHPDRPEPRSESCSGDSVLWQRSAMISHITQTSRTWLPGTRIVGCFGVCLTINQLECGTHYTLVTLNTCIV